jgi:hypothetical protein
MPLSRRATPHPNAPREPLFLDDPSDDYRHRKYLLYTLWFIPTDILLSAFPMLMSPSQPPSYINRDLRDEGGIPPTPRASAPRASPPTPTSSFFRPASIRHLLVDSPQASQAPALPGPDQVIPIQGPRLPSIDSLPLSSGSLRLPPIGTSLLRLLAYLAFISY